VRCDIVLPEQDGCVFLSNLRANLEPAHTSVVLMSGIPAMQDRK